MSNTGQYIQPHGSIHISDSFHSDFIPNEADNLIMRDEEIALVIADEAGL